VQTALKHNPDMNTMRSRVLLSKHVIEEKRAVGLGALNATASYMHYNIPRTLKPLVPPIVAGVETTKDPFSVGLAYNVALFTGFKEQKDIEMSKLEETIAASSVQVTAQQLVYNVRSLYIKILTSQELLSAQENYLHVIEKLHETIALEVSLGKKARIDILKSEAVLEESRLDIMQLKSNIAILKATLAMLMGVESVETVENIAMEHFVTESDAKAYEAQIETLDRYRSVALHEQQSQKKYEKANAAYYPQVLFSSSYVQNFSSDANEALWQAGVNVNWTLFDFGKRNAQLQSAAIAQMQSKYQSTKMKLQMKKEFIEATSNMQTLQQSIKTHQAEVALLDETQKIEQVRYESGVIEVNDLLQAKAKLLLGETRLIETTYRYRDALYYLQYLYESEPLL
jgi:outer membrane protein TolC